MKCPYCGCEQFYCKDADDPYEIYEFCYENGRAVFTDPDGDGPDVMDDTEIHCNDCAWHGKEKELK